MYACSARYVKCLQETVVNEHINCTLTIQQDPGDWDIPVMTFDTPVILYELPCSIMIIFLFFYVFFMSRQQKLCTRAELALLMGLLEHPLGIFQTFWAVFCYVPSGSTAVTLGWSCMPAMTATMPLDTTNTTTFSHNDGMTCVVVLIWVIRGSSSSCCCSCLL